MGGSIGRIVNTNLLRQLLLGVITAGTAVLLGVLIANGVNAKRDRDFRASRKIKTNDILSQMGTIRVGDILADHLFVDSSGRLAALSDLVSDVLVLCYVDPGCGACVGNLRCLTEEMNDPVYSNKVLLVFESSEDAIIQLQLLAGSNFSTLRDDNRSLANNLNLSSLPFTVVLGYGLIVEAVFIGGLLEDDCKTVVQIVRDNCK